MSQSLWQFFRFLNFNYDHHMEISWLLVNSWWLFVQFMMSQIGIGRNVSKRICQSFCHCRQMIRIFWLMNLKTVSKGHNFLKTNDDDDISIMIGICNFFHWNNQHILPKKVLLRVIIDLTTTTTTTMTF